MKKTVAIGLLGPRLDSGMRAGRWHGWRPTVALHRQPDLIIDELELLHQPNFAALADHIEADVRAVSPETTVRRHPVLMHDPWDFEEVFDALASWAETQTFDEDVDYLVHITTGTHVAQICLFLLTESRFIPGRLIQTSPPNRRTGDFGAYSTIDLDLSRYDRIAQRFAAQAEEGVAFLKAGIHTRNAAFNRLMAEIEHVAQVSKAPLLLTGPTGAGKTRLARRIFELKQSRGLVQGAFVEVNCATLRGDAAMSALFGHVRGAYTGAAQARDGLLRAADGGLLFLDEIGELGLDEQAMLLRAIESKRFLPVGSDREAQSDFQLIAGTNRDLWRAVQTGTFREDLLARVNLWTWRLPALAERPEDIEPNLDYELDEWARRQGRRVTFNREARMRFLAFARQPDALWTGNFRDLNAAVTRMATLAAAGRITETEVRGEEARLRRGWRPPPADARAIAAEALLTAAMGEGIEHLDRFDRVQLADVLLVCQQSKSMAEAGRRLFAQSRQRRKQINDGDRLRKYLAKFGLTWQTLPWG